MPQFDPVNFLPQFVWLAVLFAILYFGIVRTTLPRLERAMTARDGQRSGDLDTALDAKQEADRMAEAHAAEIAKAQDAARARLNTAHEAATKALEEQLAESKKTLDARFEAADAALAEARKQAMREIEQVAADAASDIVEKLTGSRPAEGEARSAVSAALV